VKARDEIRRLLLLYDLLKLERKPIVHELDKFLSLDTKTYSRVISTLSASTTSYNLKSNEDVGELSMVTCLDNNNEGGLEERWIGCRI